MADVQALEGLEIFGGLAEDELEKVAGLMKEVTANAGEWVFREGEEGDSLYVILAGAVDITQQVTDGVEATLVTLPAGTVFGEMVLVDPGLRSAGARAAQDARMQRLVRRDFFDLAASEPDLGIKVFLNLAILLTGRLRNANIALRELQQQRYQIDEVSSMRLETLAEKKVEVEVELLTGTRFTGTIQGLEQDGSQAQLVLLDPSRVVHLVPRHAIAAVRARLPEKSL